MKLTVYHDGQEREVQVRLAERPDLEGFAQQVEDAHEQGGPKLGLKLQEVDPRLMPNAKQGALVVEVSPGSPADRAGLQPGMVIVEAGGQPVTDPRDFAQVLQAHKGSSMLLLRIAVGDSRLLRALPIPKGR